MLHVQHFQIPSETKTPIAIDVTSPENPSGIVALYAHGISGFKDWGGMDLIAQQFAEAGITFVKFNYSTNGTTPAHLTEFVDLEAYGHDNYLTRQAELKRMVDWINSPEFPGMLEQLTIIGHSRGGMDALLFVGTDDRVSKLVTWAAPSNAKTPWSKWDYHRIQEWKNEDVQYIKNGRTGQEMPLYYQLKEENNRFGMNRLNPIKAAENLQKPWLIVHGSEDEAVPLSQANDHQSRQPNALLKVIEDTGHTFGRKHPWDSETLPKASELLTAATIEFIRQ